MRAKKYGVSSYVSKGNHALEDTLDIFRVDDSEEVSSNLLNIVEHNVRAAKRLADIAEMESWLKDQLDLNCVRSNFYVDQAYSLINRRKRELSK